MNPVFRVIAAFALGYLGAYFFEVDRLPTWQIVSGVVCLIASFEISHWKSDPRP